MQHRPEARQDDLIIKDVADETLVYDRRTDQAHCLNLTSTRIWKFCNGKRTVAEITALIAEQNNAPVSQELIWLALSQLEKFGLLEKIADTVPELTGINRRELVRRIGVGALALPLIVSISAATAQAQASLLAPGRCCGNPSQCTSNNCAQTPTCLPPPPAAPSTKACA